VRREPAGEPGILHPAFDHATNIIHLLGVCGEPFLFSHSAPPSSCSSFRAVESLARIRPVALAERI
jgi:hypothetical protein